MTSVSNISNGALIASNSAAKAQREFSKSIAKLSTGKRALYGADPAGQGIADTLNAKSKSWYVAGRNAEDGISAAQIAVWFQHNWQFINPKYKPEWWGWYIVAVPITWPTTSPVINM